MSPNIPSTSETADAMSAIPSHPPQPLRQPPPRPPPPQRIPSSGSATLNKGTSKEAQRQKSTFISCTHW